MAKQNDLIAERLRKMNESKEDLKKEKPSVMDSIATGKDEKPDFLKMANALVSQEENKQPEYIKDTIYIRSDLFAAMQSLCKKPGDKKNRVNNAYEVYLNKIYKEMGLDLSDVEPLKEPIRLKKPRKSKK